MSVEDNKNYSEVEEEEDSDVSLDEEDEELIWRVFFSGERNGDEEDEEDEQGEENSLDDGIDVYDVDLDDINDPELVAKYKSLIELKVDKNISEEEKKRLLTSNLTNSQMDRFEAYRGMKLNRPGVKKICNGVLGHSIPNQMAVVLSGISKLLLGEIITRAFEVQERDNKARLIEDISFKKKQKQKILKDVESGKEVEIDEKRLHFEGDIPQPLQPSHIREAWRLYKLESSSAFSSQWRKQGDSDGKFFR